MPNSNSFSHFIIVESLPPGDTRTGTRLHEDIMSHRTFHQRGIGVSLVTVRNRSELISVLEKLATDASTNGIRPILHVECHGAKEGLALADDSFFRWEDLKPLLVSINEASRCNLLIVLAACWGGYLINVISATERAPFWGIIGPSEPDRADHLLSNFTAFYTRLLDPSSEALALPTLLQETNYCYTSVQTFFEHAYASYLKNHCSEKDLSQRARVMSRELKRQGAADPPGPAATRRLLKRQLRSDFEKCRRCFFMIDLYGENENRFLLSYDEVTALSD